ncbi:MAG: hypothetical protein FJ161_02185 [Gammaproteobacteria bacterium]|nr:hypothetical protein [Gammaproteobacteria bacterium]
MLSEGYVSQCEQLYERLYRVQCVLTSAYSFYAGQYVSLYLHPHDPKPFATYSYATPPSDLPFVEFYLRHPIPSKIGQKIYFSPPKGAMTALDYSKEYILCAGGTGITPFLSLLKQYPDRKLRLYWSMMDARDLLLMPKEMHRDTVICTLFDNNSDSDLYKALEENKNLFSNETNFYLAGPIVFIDSLADFLIKKNLIKGVSQLSSDLRVF